ncbi:MAG: hypothetical protein IPK80_00035 [Nannocystis sp.]|nr:hypothetical protein [Nannocystis sp.]
MPRFHNVRCDEVAGCLSWARGGDLIGEQRFFVPAERSKELEDALRSRSARIRASITSDGVVAVDTLLLDGEPWQEALAAEVIRGGDAAPAATKREIARQGSKRTNQAPRTIEVRGA